MATPITNNNPALVGNNKTLRPETAALAAGPGPAALESTADGQQEYGVTVSRAAQVLNQQPGERGEGVIQSADQASATAKGLRALFEGGNSQTLAALATNVSADLMGLLKAG